MFVVSSSFRSVTVARGVAASGELELPSAAEDSDSLESAVLACEELASAFDSAGDAGRDSDVTEVTELVEDEVRFRLTVSHCSMLLSLRVSGGRYVRNGEDDGCLGQVQACHSPAPNPRDSRLHHRTRSPDKRALWARGISRSVCGLVLYGLN